MKTRDLRSATSTCSRETGPEGSKARFDPFQLLEVLFGERAEAALAERREGETDYTLVVGVDGARDETGGLGAVDELHRAVVTQEQMVGDVADGRAERVVVAADGEEQLVLRRREPGFACLALAPAEEAAQAVTEVEQPAEVVVG